MGITAELENLEQNDCRDSQRRRRCVLPSLNQATAHLPERNRAIDIMNKKTIIGPFIKKERESLSGQRRKKIDDQKITVR